MAATPPTSEAAPSSQSGDVPVAQFAQVAEVTAHYIRRLQREGVLPLGQAKGTIPFVAGVRAMFRFMRDAERRSTKSAAESRVKDARAREIEQRMAIKQRELIPMGEATEAMDALCAIVRECIEGMPAGVTRERQLRLLLEKSVHDALRRIADRAQEVAATLRAGGDVLETRRRPPPGSLGTEVPNLP